VRFRPPPVGRGDAPESECRLTRGGPPPPNRGHLKEAGPGGPRRQGDLGTRSRAPATLVDTTFGAIADAGSIPAVSTLSLRKPNHAPSSGGAIWLFSHAAYRSIAISRSLSSWWPSMPSVVVSPSGGGMRCGVDASHAPQFHRERVPRLVHVQPERDARTDQPRVLQRGGTTSAERRAGLAYPSAGLAASARAAPPGPSRRRARPPGTADSCRPAGAPDVRHVSREREPQLGQDRAPEPKQPLFLALAEHAHSPWHQATQRPAPARGARPAPACSAHCPRCAGSARPVDHPREALGRRPHRARRPRGTDDPANLRLLRAAA
jgi:hypothetical protein